MMDVKSRIIQAGESTAHDQGLEGKSKVAKRIRK